MARNTGMEMARIGTDSNKMPRPIFAPSDNIITYEKHGFMSGLSTFPAP